jgi:hypothetical protein
VPNPKFAYLLADMSFCVLPPVPNPKLTYLLADMQISAKGCDFVSLQRATPRPIREPQIPSPLPTQYYRPRERCTRSSTLILYHFEAGATPFFSFCTVLHALPYITLARFRYKLYFIVPLPSAFSTIPKWPKEGPPTAPPTELPSPPTELNINSFAEACLLQLNRARLLHLEQF